MSIPSFNEANLEQTCNVIGDTGSGLTGSEISRYLHECGIADPSPAMTKRIRLFNALVTRQRSDGCANNICAFIQRVMNPVLYVNSPEYFKKKQAELNRVLSFEGLRLSEEGKLEPCKQARTITAASLAFHSDAATTVITNQPPVYADREVSQDAAVAGCGAQTRIVNVELSFTATPSNNVQIAFGSDLNKDGRLSFGEVRMTVGWDCGRWFLASGDLSQEFTYAPEGSGTGSVYRTLKMPVRLNAGGVPLALSFADGSSPFTFENLTSVPGWMRPQEWSMLRLTARGWDGRDEQALVKMSLDGNVIILR